MNDNGLALPSRSMRDSDGEWQVAGYFIRTTS